jgi:hypothetical protein
MSIRVNDTLVPAQASRSSVDRRTARVLTICLKSPESFSARGDGVSDDADRLFHEADGAFHEADGVFHEADALPRHEFVNYMTVSHQPRGLTQDSRTETWIRGR